MATFSYNPSYSAKAVRAPKTKTARFGDGYEMRAEDGINTNPENWDLQFINRDTTEGDAIDAFLSDKKGVTPFQWTTPRGVSGNFVCKSWTYDLGSGNLVSITARFEQVFDPI